MSKKVSTKTLKLEFDGGLSLEVVPVAIPANKIVRYDPRPPYPSKWRSRKHGTVWVRDHFFACTDIEVLTGRRGILRTTHRWTLAKWEEYAKTAKRID